jgi:hypothetical protein
VGSDDDTFVSGLQPRSIGHELVPEVDLAYFVAVAGHYEVYEGADHLVSAESASQAEWHIAERVERRALELLDLKGWARFRGILCPDGGGSDGGPCGLILSSSPNDPLVERRVALRDEWVMELPGPGYPPGRGVEEAVVLRCRPLAFLARADLGPEAASPEPSGQLSTVRALMASADPLSPSPRQNMSVAVEVARRTPSYGIGAESYEDGCRMIRGLTSG